MASSVNISQLAADLQKHIADNPGLLTKALISAFSFLNYFTTLTDISDEIPLVELVTGSVLQPGNKDTFNPQDDKINFKNRMGKVRDCKIDLQIKPSQVEQMKKSYLAKMDTGKYESVYEFPFEQFIIMKVLEKLMEDIHLSAVYKGAYNAAGSSPGDVFDGILTKMAADILSGDIPAGNVFTGVAITPTNAIAQFEGVADIVDDAYMNRNLVCIASPENKKNYNRNYRATYGSLNYNNDFEKTMIDGTNIEIVADPGKSGSDRLTITTRENLFWLIDSQSRMSDMTVEYALRNINMMVDFKASVEYGIAELIWTNDYVGI